MTIICPNCKSNISQGETPCKVCGANIVWKTVQNPQPNYNTNPQNQAMQGVNYQNQNPNN